MSKVLIVSLLCATLPACTRQGELPPTRGSAAALSAGLDLAAVDKTVRPQDDLFAHVNGGWLAKTDIPADKASYGSFDALVDRAQADLRTIVELPTEFPGFDWAAWTSELGLSQVQSVIIAQPSYVKAFADTVHDVPVGVWKPYLRASLPWL
ncbi:MAG: hypothetical protein ACT4QD_20435 [Acidobacteriota bacterium]